MAHDAHARPPESMRALFKRWQRATVDEIDASDEILDLSCTEKHASQLAEAATILEKEFKDTCERFLEDNVGNSTDPKQSKPVAYEVRSLPGLFIYPRLLPHAVQIALLNKLIHRDLSIPSHKSNLHLHYLLPYPRTAGDEVIEVFGQSFFHADRSDILSPKDSTVHKPLTVKQMLDRKLRWVTLGGQYDWTAKKYPTEAAPQFPEDVARLLKGLFPRVDAQAAIVNFYTPGDTLSVHRDVSEECDRGLISISIGCDGLFTVGNEDGSQSATIRLRSGDVVLMSGWLQTWPASIHNDKFADWRGWISNKRINLNVRQMQA